MPIRRPGYEILRPGARNAGWLGLFAFALCASVARSIAELAEAMPVYRAGFRNEAAHGPLIVAGLVTLAGIAVHLWAIVARLRKKRELASIYSILLTLTLAAPFSLLPLLTLPGVRPLTQSAANDPERTSHRLSWNPVG